MQKYKPTRTILLSGFLLLLSSMIFAQVTLLGDVNDDGNINIVDALSVAQYSVGCCTPPIIQNGDVDGNGVINIVDALIIAQFYVGLIDVFPAAATPVPTIPPKGTPPPTSGAPIPYMEEFQIGYGETMGDIDELLITFSAVSDSRCPSDVVCVWEGEVIITLDVWLQNQNMGSFEIKAPPATPGRISLDDPDTGGYQIIECMAVEPYPATALDPPAPEEYVATLFHVIAVP